MPNCSEFVKRRAALHLLKEPGVLGTSWYHMIIFVVFKYHIFLQCSFWSLTSCPVFHMPDTFFNLMASCLSRFGKILDCLSNPCDSNREERGSGEGVSPRHQSLFLVPHPSVLKVNIVRVIAP